MVVLQEMSITQAHEGIKRGDFTVTDLVGAFLQRIEAFDKVGPRINAMMALSNTALEEAAQLDRYFKNTGKFKGKLHGIPVVVKDQADTKGIVTTYGSAVALDNVPEKDAFVITKLKEAGAVILGKTTTSEWACCWFSANGATGYEFTKNPYSLSHDVGASSGGSAAALAANFAILAVGEDTGGSIRVPSSFCNLVGIRPTPGLISRTGFCPLIKTQDTPGPMARSVWDCASMLDCMVGFDPEDDFTGLAATAAAMGLPKGGRYTAFLENGLEKIRKAKVGVVRQLFGSDDDLSCRAVNGVIASAFEKLKSIGVTFVDVNIEDLRHYMIYSQTYRVRSRIDINTFLATKPHLPADIAEIVPRTPNKPYLDLLSAAAHGPEDPTTEPTYAGRLLARDELKRKINCLIASLGLDALVFPDLQIPPPRFEDATNGRIETLKFPTNTFLSSQTCLPAISVPAGFTQDGLPVGLELLGLEYQEQHLLELARGVEATLEARMMPCEDSWAR
ncbi:amidase signature enzyme [Penicillium cosmopolitanum]|uniref:Amidase signature enzyme n=1 Tax=Penicillium cosmopolitanum TaxID=1131564 RepID=A0A9W9WAC6_9EURO|nr:amidase signature enzyme [Penicillium cosmopolitanum]KAJ5413713.1 amidase signature enzyme [Penicillium cosmopolitanum]